VARTVTQPTTSGVPCQIGPSVIKGVRNRAGVHQRPADELIRWPFSFEAASCGRGTEARRHGFQRYNAVSLHSLRVSPRILMEFRDNHPRVRRGESRGGSRVAWPEDD